MKMKERISMTHEIITPEMFSELLYELGEKVGHTNYDYQFTLDEIKDTEIMSGIVKTKLEWNSILNRINDCW